MLTATVENVRTSSREVATPFWANVTPERDTPSLDGHSASITVVTQGGNIASQARVALDEFRKLLRETAHGVVSPLMLMSIILSTRNQENDPVCESSVLLEKFGSVSNLLSRTYSELRNCSNLDDDSVVLLRAVRELVVLVLREPIEDKPLISNNQALLSYLKFTLAHECVECVKLLFLTSRNTLIRDEIHATGTVNFVVLHPREVLRRALQVGAAALIIVHNHPSGDVTPSIEDVEMTRNLRSVLNAVQVSLHDHVIVGSSKCYSMKENDLL